MPDSGLTELRVQPRGPHRHLAALGLLVSLTASLGCEGWVESTRTDPASVTIDHGVVEQAFADGRSDVLVTLEGRVDRVLSDDREGSRHQRFILELASGHTVLVAHNIDLAPRVPDLHVDAEVLVRGEYEWNPRGGVIHWTHHDPRGRHPGGWIEWRGERYQ